MKCLSRLFAFWHRPRPAPAPEPLPPVFIRSERKPGETISRGMIKTKVGNAFAYRPEWSEGTIQSPRTSHTLRGQRFCLAVILQYRPPATLAGTDHLLRVKVLREDLGREVFCTDFTLGELALELERLRQAGKDRKFLSCKHFDL